MEWVVLLLIIVVAALTLRSQKPKPKAQELPAKLSETDELIEDLIWQQVGGAISRLSTNGKTHLIERIKKLPARELKNE